MNASKMYFMSKNVKTGAIAQFYAQEAKHFIYTFA